MYCGKCGLPLKDDETVCPNCNLHTEEVIKSEVIDNTTSTSKYEEYKETEKLYEKYNFTKLLIFSIIEFICCFKPMGILTAILLVVQLKPAIDKHNFVEAEKSKKLIEILLIIGLILGLVFGIFYIVTETLGLFLSESY